MPASAPAAGRRRALCLLALHFLLIYLRSTKVNKKTGKRPISTTQIVLATEFVAQGLLAMYFFVNGQWRANQPALFAFSLYSHLGGTGFATTFMTAIFWSGK